MSDKQVGREPARESNWRKLARKVEKHRGAANGGDPSSPSQRKLPLNLYPLQIVERVSEPPPPMTPMSRGSTDGKATALSRQGRQSS